MAEPHRAEHHEGSFCSSGAGRRPIDHALNHDLRARLRAVTGFIDLLFDDPMAKTGLQSGEEAIRCLTIAFDSARTADKMVERLAIYHRLGRSPLDPEPVDLVELVDELLGDMAPVTGTDGAPVPVVVDDRLLTDAIFEIYDNARNHCRDGAIDDETDPVVIEVFGDGPWAVIAITDNGVGIKPERLARSLELGRQVQDRIDESRTGLGLPMAERILELHGGELAIGSTPGSGTTVELRVPRAVQE